MKHFTNYTSKNENKSLCPYPGIKKDSSVKPDNLFIPINVRECFQRKGLRIASYTLCFVIVSSTAFPATANAFDLRKIDNPMINLFIILSLLSFIPAVLVMFTSFTRIVVVLSFLRHAIGGQQIPPNPVIIGLSLFLTLFVMAPVVKKIQADAVTPYVQEKITFVDALQKAEPTIKGFMLKQTREKDLGLFMDIAGIKKTARPEDLSLTIVIPAFAISELRTAFEIGFLIYLPFLVIDMVVASVLLSLGMMMLPPVIISLPFKLLLFVLVDGWNLLIGSLLRSFH
ncbi:Flagellar biosynthesis protein FliP [hydrothermal vent metagenome]|uniref:Flagellar biosynthetic protein FliP n=1 Tax=hydrothermal vent metagenome TaxID=652676 RepID=A0A3B1CWI9_9ZZZZ